MSGATETRRIPPSGASLTAHPPNGLSESVGLEHPRIRRHRVYGNSPVRRRRRIITQWREAPTNLTARPPTSQRVWRPQSTDAPLGESPPQRHWTTASRKLPPQLNSQCCTPVAL